MKPQTLSIYSGNIFDAALEEIIQKKDTELKESARKNAKHFARAKPNLPAKEDETLAPYIGEIKAGYEHLASQVLHHLQPAAHFPEAKMDAEYFKEADKELDVKIKNLEDANRADEYEGGNNNSGNILLRSLAAGIATFIINIGEVIFNTKSFQITGDNMLFALIISISVSFTVFAFSHFAPFLYKSAKSVSHRRLVLFGSLLGVTILFTVLAIFRSTVLAIQDVHIAPFYFVIINLFFFIVSALISFFVLPSWAEIKENASRIKLALAITKRKKEIENLKKEKDAIRKTILERTKNRVRIAHYANYAAERIRKLYFEAVEIFKSTNLTYRTDGQMPDSFSALIPEPNIDNFEIIFNVSNIKTT